MANLPNDLAQASAQLIDELANQEGKKYAEVDRLKTNQLRNIFASINSIRTNYKNEKDYTENIERSLIMLKPMLAYAKGRQPQMLSNFQQFSFKAIDSVHSSKDKKKALENFFLIIEGIVAYHKFYGGKEK